MRIVDRPNDLQLANFAIIPADSINYPNLVWGDLPIAYNIGRWSSSASPIKF
jgi:hypothetical protein